MSKRIQENLNQSKNTISRNISGLNSQQIKNIKVVIHRPFLHNTDMPDDPSTLAIHQMGEGLQYLFSRKDVIVKIEGYPEEKIKDKLSSHSSSPRQSGNAKTITNDKYVRSPSYRGKTRLLHWTKRTQSPHSSKRRSQSPYARRTPNRSIRTSKSSNDEKKKVNSGGSCCRKTILPYRRKRSRSPYRYRKSTITPSSRHRHYNKDDRSKFRHSHNDNNLLEKYSTELPGYESKYPEFTFYEPNVYWMPGQCQCLNLYQEV